MKKNKFFRWLHQNRYDLLIIAFILGFVVLFYQLKGHFGFLSDRESFITLIQSFGPWGPLVLIFITIVEVIVAPIPGGIPAITAGFIFGLFWGAVYTYIGNIIGTLLVFLIARKWGRQIVIKLFKRERLERYEKAISRRENLYLAIFFIPVMPLDVLSAAFGLSQIRFRKFLIVILLGFTVYSFTMTFFGDYLAKLFF